MKKIFSKIMIFSVFCLGGLAPDLKANPPTKSPQQFVPSYLHYFKQYPGLGVAGVGLALLSLYSLYNSPEFLALLASYVKPAINLLKHMPAYYKIEWLAHKGHKAISPFYPVVMDKTAEELMLLLN
jgi:hypothetical protein